MASPSLESLLGRLVCIVTFAACMQFVLAHQASIKCPSLKPSRTRSVFCEWHRNGKHVSHPLHCVSVYPFPDPGISAVGDLRLRIYFLLTRHAQVIHSWKKRRADGLGGSSICIFRHDRRYDDDDVASSGGMTERDATPTTRASAVRPLCTPRPPPTSA